MFEVGDKVKKKKGYSFSGIVVSRYTTLKEELRFVVECTVVGAAGMQHIYSANDLEFMGEDDAKV